MLPDWRCSISSTRSVVGSEPVCPPECNQYKGAMDVLYKVIRQVCELVNLSLTSILPIFLKNGSYVSFKMFPMYFLND
jgi:hypothetical protein